MCKALTTAGRGVSLSSLTPSDTTGSVWGSHDFCATSKTVLAGMDQCVRPCLGSGEGALEAMPWRVTSLARYHRVAACMSYCAAADLLIVGGGSTRTGTFSRDLQSHRIHASVLTLRIAGVRALDLSFLALCLGTGPQTVVTVWRVGDVGSAPAILHEVATPVGPPFVLTDPLVRDFSSWCTSRHVGSACDPWCCAAPEEEASESVEARRASPGGSSRREDPASGPL
jgi:hypothetical protein